MKSLIFSALLLLTSCAKINLTSAHLNTMHEVHRIIKYQADEGDYWQSPEETRQRGFGDCEDLAFLLQDELKRKGYETIVKLGRIREDSEYHAWLEFEADGNRYILDPTTDKALINPEGYHTWQ